MPLIFKKPVTLQLFRANTRFSPMDGPFGDVGLSGGHCPSFLDLFPQIVEVSQKPEDLIFNH